MKPPSKDRASKDLPANPAAPANDGLGVGCWVLIALAALAGIAKCSSDSPTQQQTSAIMTEAPEAIASSIATQSPEPPAALSEASVRKGAQHLAVAAREELAGEMIYSQNCYDSLSRHFSWPKLDRCGAFDLAAVEALGDQCSPSARMAQI